MRIASLYSVITHWLSFQWWRGRIVWKKKKKKRVRRFTIPEAFLINILSITIHVMFQEPLLFGRITDLWRTDPNYWDKVWCDSLPSCALKAVHHYCHLSHVEIHLPIFYFPSTFNDDNTTTQLAEALLYKYSEIELWTRTRKGIPRIRLRKLQLSGFLSCYLWFAKDKKKHRQSSPPCSLNSISTHSTLNANRNITNTYSYCFFIFPLPWNEYFPTILCHQMHRVQ